ncbi:MAG TPA: S41 family peptidase [Polyangiaceae bacterium]|nr:S41 family peptidase [Polyangiaceae bacterium]
MAGATAERTAAAGCAAEIAAAAVQDHRRGRLVGRVTNGSVLNSRKYPLPDGGMMMVPVKDFHRAGNRRIEGVGVEPDVWIMPTIEDVRAGRDAALDKAIEELQSLKTGAKTLRG